MDEGKLRGGTGGVKTQSEVPALAGGSEGSGGGGAAEGVCSDVHGGTSHVPVAPGQLRYLKRKTVYHSCTVVSLGELASNGKVTPTARVRYYSEGEPLICRQDELITQQQYDDLVAARRKQAYENDRESRLVEARGKYARVVTLWANGIRAPAEFIKETGVGTPLFWGGQIAAAKRWELIRDDPRSDGETNYHGVSDP